jgi:hypothetical protein
MGIGSSAASAPGLGYRSSTTYWNSTSSSMDNTPVTPHFLLPSLRDSRSSQERGWNSRQPPGTPQTPLSLFQASGSSSSDSAERQMSFPTSSTSSATPSAFDGYESQTYSSQ